MRWKEKRVGDKRIVRKFLLLPRSINGEVRWLEHATFSQQLAIGMHWADYEWLTNDGEK